jgi:hypothetical protein
MAVIVLLPWLTSCTQIGVKLSRNPLSVKCASEIIAAAAAHVHMCESSLLHQQLEKRAPDGSESAIKQYCRPACRLYVCKTNISQLFLDR